MTSSRPLPALRSLPAKPTPTLPNSKLKSVKPNLIGSTLVAIYIFFLVGRALDVSPIAPLHIPLMLLLVLIVTTVSRGDFDFAFQNKMTRYFAAFTVWVIICFPFSTWRADSVHAVQLQIQSFVIFMIIVQLIRTRRDWEKMASAYAYAILVASLLTFKYGHMVEGRLALAGGTLGDPNEFALHMVIGLPFWWFKASRATGFKKIAFLLCTVPIFYAFARAGSRSGLLALAVLFLLSFLFAEGGKKVLIAAATVGGIAVSTVFLPGYVQTRFLTFFTPKDGGYDAATQARIQSDIASSENRKALLMQSISMTFRHPLLGVGPGDFSFVSWDERKAATGVGGENLVSHNTYTQISSETGFPGFFLFLATVVLALRYSFGDYRRLLQIDTELANYGRYMFSALLALAVGIFFLSVGYTHLIGIIFALTLAFRRIVQELESSRLSSPGIAIPNRRSLNQPALSRPKYTPLARPNLPAAPGSRRPVRHQIPSLPAGQRL